MAYDLHIEETGKSINDWIDFVEKSPDFEAAQDAVTDNPDTAEVIRVQTGDAAVAPNGAWFVPRIRDDGLVITVSSPDDETIQIMKQVATVLGGKVVGDEGEEY